MKLSKECIEAIENENPYNYEAAMDIFTTSVIAALTNPSILEKAGLISLEDVDNFVQWRNNTCYYSITLKGWCIFNVVSTTSLTTSQLFKIYQQQK